jgi:hypothetical protein
MISKQTSLDLNGPILSFIQQPQSVSVCDGGTYSGTTVQISTTHNNLPVRGFLYFPTTGVSGTQFDVVVLYHPTITSAGVTPFTAAENFLNITLNQINVKDKIIFSVAYPQDAIPDWEANPSLPGQQFPGIDYPNFYLGDNIAYAEAALLWVKSGGLNTHFTSNNIPRSINKIFTFGHSQGAYLTHRLNTMHAVDGVISNAPGPIDLLTRCSGDQNTINLTCNKIRVAFGSTTENPSTYDDISLKNFLSGTLSPALFTQALDDTTGNSFGAPQVANMQNIVQAGLDTCTNCENITFNYYETGGHDAFVSNTFIQNDIRTFVGSTGAGSATFVGIATATFPVQDPPNPASNTGILSYRWYVEGFGPLTDGTFQGTSIVGSGTTTLVITNAKSPIASGLRIYVDVDYVPSAYSQPVGSAVTVGTGRSTGNAINEVLDSNTATLTVFPVLSVVTQPTEQTAAQTRPATFTTLGSLTDTTQGSISYRWQLNGNDLSDSPTVTGSGTTSLSIALPNIGINAVRARLSHPTSCNSPLFTNTVNFNVVDARQIINFEYIPLSGSVATINSINLFNGEFQLNRNPSAGLISFYAPETDINLELDLYARPGFDSGGFRGGEGGYSKVRFTMPRNVEFMIASFNEAGFIVMYRQSRVMLVVATGGRAGTGGNGGPGGGVNVAGGNGFGRNAGTGAQLVFPGTLDQNASFGSGWGFSRGITRGRGPDSAGISVAPVPLGGKILNCPTGDFWRRRGISPCQSLGDIQFFTANGTRITNSATISRGFKAGNGVRQVGGYQGGGNGARGGNGAADTTAGGGGGSGYHDGSIQVIETSLGGNRGDARMVFRAV